MDWPSEAQSQGERMLLQCVRSLEPGRDAGDNMGNLRQGFCLTCQLRALPLKQGGRESVCFFFIPINCPLGNTFILKLDIANEYKVC